MRYSSWRSIPSNMVIPALTYEPQSMVIRLSISASEIIDNGSVYDVMWEWAGKEVVIGFKIGSSGWLGSVGGGKSRFSSPPDEGPGSSELDGNVGWFVKGLERGSAIPYASRALCTVLRLTPRNLVIDDVDRMV